MANEDMRQRADARLGKGRRGEFGGEEGGVEQLAFDGTVGFGLRRGQSGTVEEPSGKQAYQSAGSEVRSGIDCRRGSEVVR